MPKHRKKQSAFQRRFSRKIEINTREMKQHKLRGGAGNHPFVTNPKQMIAISASQARKGSKRR